MNRYTVAVSPVAQQHAVAYALRLSRCIVRRVPAVARESGAEFLDTFRAVAAG